MVGGGHGGRGGHGWWPCLKNMALFDSIEAGYPIEIKTSLARLIQPNISTA